MGFFVSKIIQKFDATHSVMNERLRFFILNIMEEIQQLKEEIQRLENRLTFERHNYKLNINKQREDILSALYQKSKLNISELYELAKCLKPEDGRALRMLAQNLERDLLEY